VSISDSSPALYILTDILIEPVVGSTVAWSDAYALETQGGFEDPFVLLMFIPQPDPPGDSDDTVGFAFEVTGSTGPPQDISIVLEIEEEGVPLSFTISSAPSLSVWGSTILAALDERMAELTGHPSQTLARL
jgi:hypothetical protein